MIKYLEANLRAQYPLSIKVNHIQRIQFTKEVKSSETILQYFVNKGMIFFHLHLTIHRLYFHFFLLSISLESKKKSWGNKSFEQTISGFLFY